MLSGNVFLSSILAIVFRIRIVIGILFPANQPASRFQQTTTPSPLIHISCVSNKHLTLIFSRKRRFSTRALAAISAAKATALLSPHSSDHIARIALLPRHPHRHHDRLRRLPRVALERSRRDRQHVLALRHHRGVEEDQHAVVLHADHSLVVQSHRDRRFLRGQLRLAHRLAHLHRVVKRELHTAIQRQRRVQRGLLDQNHVRLRVCR